MHFLILCKDGKMIKFCLLCLLVIQAVLFIGNSDFSPRSFECSYYRPVQKYASYSYTFRYTYCWSTWGVRYCGYYAIGRGQRQRTYYTPEISSKCCAEYGGNNCNIKRVRGVHVFPDVKGNKPSLKVSWQPIWLNVNATYKILFRSNLGTHSRIVEKPPELSICFNLENLAKSTRYTVQVAAMLGGEVGPYSSTADGTTFTDPPHPENVVVRPFELPGELNVSWSPVPESAILAKVIGYLIQYSEVWPLFNYTSAAITEVSKDMKWLLPYYTIQGLVPGSTYKVRVGTYGQMNSNKYGREINTVLHDVPGAVSHIKADSLLAVDGNICLHFSWDSPSSDVSIHAFQISYRKTEEKEWNMTSTKNTSFTLENLPRGTEYGLKVCAESSIGVGQCGQVEIRTLDVPDVVNITQSNLIPTVNKEHNSIRPALSFLWTVPQSDLPIESYQLQFRMQGDEHESASWTTVKVVNTLNRTEELLPNLEHDTIYEVRIRAVSELGTGEWSEVISKATDTIECCRKCPNINQNQIVTFPSVEMSVPHSTSSFDFDVYRFGKWALTEDLIIPILPVLGPNVFATDFHVSPTVTFHPSNKIADEATIHVILNSNSFQAKLKHGGSYSILLKLRPETGYGARLAIIESEMNITIT